MNSNCVYWDLISKWKVALRHARYDLYGDKQAVCLLTHWLPVWLAGSLLSPCVAEITQSEHYLIPKFASLVV